MTLGDPSIQLVNNHKSGLTGVVQTWDFEFQGMIERPWEVGRPLDKESWSGRLIGPEGSG
jgi:hypothetical protein